MKEASSILFVDDEERVLKALRRHFLDESYQLHFAASGADGLAVLEQTAIDVVVSDFRMPKMNGAEFLKKVSERWPETVRLVLSGYVDIGVLVTAINEGEIFKFIGKPWRENELKDAVKEAIAKRQAMDQMRQLANTALQMNDELFAGAQDDYAQIIERNSLLEAAARRLEIYEAVFQSVRLPIMVFDTKGHLLEANAAARASAGLDSGPDANPLAAEGLPGAIQQAVSRHMAGVGERTATAAIPQTNTNYRIYISPWNKDGVPSALIVWLQELERIAMD